MRKIALGIALTVIVIAGNAKAGSGIYECKFAHLYKTAGDGTLSPSKRNRNRVATLNSMTGVMRIEPIKNKTGPVVTTRFKMLETNRVKFITGMRISTRGADAVIRTITINVHRNPPTFVMSTHRGIWTGTCSEQ